MNYVAINQRPKPAAVLGAFGVPAAFGALLVIGLAVHDKIADEIPNLKGITITPDKIEVPPPPPPDPAKTKADPRTSNPQNTVQPDTPFDFDQTSSQQNQTFDNIDNNIFDPTGPLDPNLGSGTDIGGGTVIEPPELFDPIAAKPKGNPGSWITDNDYRPSWVRRGMAGNARFDLEISASGRVTSCSIIGSTGHTPLDTATCRLIQKRARFEPARDSSGDKVAGSYRNSVNWRLPE